MLYRSGDRVVTWREAEAITDRAAAKLAALGAGPGAVLGLWMLPLGLLLFAQDIPPLQKPLAQMLGWIERKWLERQRAKFERERAGSPQ